MSTQLFISNTSLYFRCMNENPKVCLYNFFFVEDLDFCSNTLEFQLKPLHSRGFKDYSLTEQSGKHVNNLVGLHSAVPNTNRQTIRHSVLSTIQSHASKSHALSLSHRFQSTQSRKMRGKIIKKNDYCTHQKSFREQL